MTGHIDKQFRWVLSGDEETRWHGRDCLGFDDPRADAFREWRTRSAIHMGAVAVVSPTGEVRWCGTSSQIVLILGNAVPPRPSRTVRHFILGDTWADESPRARAERFRKETT